MARTTLDLDPGILRELRERATREGKSMGAVASELLAQQLAQPEVPPAAREFRWISRDLGVPRVDLGDKDALYALLDQDECASRSTPMS
jgi:plasmid stability protein